jgi:hypothetical protein
MHSNRRSWRMTVAVCLSLGLVAAMTPVYGEKVARPAGGSFRNTTAGGLNGLALPDPYVQHIQDRMVIDAYQGREHAAAPGILPTARPRYASPPRVEGAVRTVRAALPPAVAAFRATNREPVLPSRGFRAPILENHAEQWLPRIVPTDAVPSDRAGVTLVESRLAADGLLATLARLLHEFGAAACLADPQAAWHRLQAVGYPVDLLHHFRVENVADSVPRPVAIIEWFARRLLASKSVEQALQAPWPIQFDFQASVPGHSWINRQPGRESGTGGQDAEDSPERGERFEIASESGEHEIGLVRMQVGGGWRDGIVPGGSLDVIGQMVDQIRSADFLLSIGADASGSMQSLITNSWRLRRRGQVTLCEETVEPSAWAQDNGKAGQVRSRSGRPSRLATLVPRFACMDEGKSVFVPGESYLADGLRAAGHAVIHSPLLFQGGNVLCLRHPASGRRWLILGEGTLHRNTALGLTSTQVLGAFQEEFGVDQCFVLPGLSYHLDFDVTFRAVQTNLIAFVNDTPAAAREIVGLGIAALEKHALLSGPAAAQLSAQLRARQDLAVVTGVSALMRAQKDAAGVYPPKVSAAFAGDPIDDAVGNFQIFLLALDVLESGLPPAKPAGAVAVAAPAGGRAAYLAALRRMEKSRQRQMATLEQLDCRIVRVPSMHDLYRSVNYLNGIQHRGGYVMPTFGGFFAPLDQAAATIFREALGSGQHVSLIRTAECQRMHGGVHCTASAYPRL